MIVANRMMKAREPYIGLRPHLESPFHDGFLVRCTTSGRRLGLRSRAVTYRCGRTRGMCIEGD